jgi:diacylglycerol kinase (ATP)
MTAVTPAGDAAHDGTTPPPPRTGAVAVVAHLGKTFGGGLSELRRLLAEAGVTDPLWYEVPKSRKAPKKVRKALKKGADLVFVWGGDGMVQRCTDALAGTGVPVAILPAGTANLFATNLGIPKDLPEAVRIGLYGARRLLDLGVVNGEHFAVMAGLGFDARMIKDADRGLKDRIGRLAYAWTGLRNVAGGDRKVKVKLDGKTWYKGHASCVLLGNVGTITGGIPAFAEARPDDGWLDVGVVTAEGAAQWARTLGRMVTGHPDRSPFVRTGRARKIKVRLTEPIVYELDGGARERVDRLTAKVHPEAITVCVPRP